VGGPRRVWALAAVMAALALTGCNSLIDQPTVYTSAAMQTVTGTAATRQSDPLVAVTVNGVAAALEGQKYSATIPLDGVTVFNRVLVVASYQSGATQADRATVVDADGTHATLVAKGTTVSAGAFAWKALPSTSLTIPTSIYSCGASCTVSVSATSATVGDPGVPPSMSITTMSTSVMGVDMRVPRVREYLQVTSLGRTCSAVATVDPVDVYQFVVPTVPSMGGFALRPAGGTTALGPPAATLTGCATLPPAVLDPVATNTATQVVAMLKSQLTTPIISPSGSAPWPDAISSGLETVLSALTPAAATPIDGLTLTPTFTSGSLSTDGTGLSLTDDQLAAASSVASGAPAQPSSLGFGAGTAAPTTATTPNGASYDVAYGTSVTALNQVLSAETERGLFDESIRGDADSSYTFNGLSGTLDLGPALATDRPVEIDLTPQVSPAVTSADAPDASHVGVVHVGGLRISLQYSDTHAPILEQVVDFDAPVELSMNGGEGVLSATMPSLGAIHADVVKRGSGVGADASTLLLDWLNDHPLGALGTGGVPVLSLPTLPGVPSGVPGAVPTGSPTLTQVEADRVGDSLYLYATSS
jgi:hypothetical protein